MLTFNTPVILASATAKVPTFTMNAYNGGKMRPTLNGAPLLAVVDLGGIEIPKTVPILLEHNAAVGHAAEVRNDGKSLFVTGALSKPGRDRDEVLAASKGGFPWQASISADVLQSRQVEKGEWLSINGQTQVGPFLLVEKSLLREISFTQLGGDHTTAVRIAARLQTNNGDNMDTENQIHEDNATSIATAAVDAERERVAVIMNAAKKFGASPDTIEAAIRHDTTGDMAELRFHRAARPQGPTVMVPGSRAQVNTTDALTAALLVRGGRGALAEKEYGEKVMQASQRFQHASLVDVCRSSLAAEGKDASGPAPAMIKAALSTHNLQQVLTDTANKFLLDGFRDSPATWRSFTAVRSTSDFKDNRGIRANITGSLEKLGRGGEVKHASLAEESYTWRADTFAKMLSLDRKDIINDDLGAFHESAAGLGRMAQRSLNDLVYGTLLNATSAYFDASLGNTGILPLTIEGLSAAYTAMSKQRDSEGNDLDLRPTTLLVPPELKDTAAQLLSSEQVMYLVDPAAAPGTATAYPTGNPSRNALRLEVEPRLSNAVKYPGKASPDAWYLFAAPSDGAMITGFLNGVQTPTIEYFDFSSDPTRLAATWRCYFDFGVALSDFRAAMKQTPQ